MRTLQSEDKPTNGCKCSSDMGFGKMYNIPTWQLKGNSVPVKSAVLDDYEPEVDESHEQGNENLSTPDRAIETLVAQFSECALRMIQA